MPYWVFVNVGADHEVITLSGFGVELMDSLSLIYRANLHDLLFFDGEFNLVFIGLDEALFLAQFEQRWKGTVRLGSACMVVVREEEVREVVGFLMYVLTSKRLF